MSTIPDHLGTVEFGHARAVSSTRSPLCVAAELHLLLDYHAAMSTLPHAGISDDNVHPSSFVEIQDTRAAVFTSRGCGTGTTCATLPC
ncbi:MAG: hypothetical protein R3A48_07195 [Polyangiales bacterium]